MRAIKINKVHGYINTDIDIHNWLDAQIKNVCNGEYEISIKRVTMTRTTEQNALMWVWFTIIAQAWSEATGRTFTPQNVHDAYCQLFLPQTTPKGINIAGSTKKLDTKEMTEFLNKVKADVAQEYGITLPTADDKYYSQLIENYY